MVWERIHELEKQEQQRIRGEAARKESDRIARETQATIKAQRETQERERKERERRKINKEIIEKSGALSIMKEIDRGLEGNVRKHAIVGSLESGYIRLAWGNKFKVIDENIIGYERFLGIKYTGIKDYSYIEVVVNSDDESIKINNKIVKKDQWQTNKTAVQDLLAQAYHSPYRVNDREEPPSKSSGYSSSSSSNTECCSH